MLLTLLWYTKKNESKLLKLSCTKSASSTDPNCWLSLQGTTWFMSFQENLVSHYFYTETLVWLEHGTDVPFTEDKWNPGGSVHSKKSVHFLFHLVLGCFRKNCKSIVKCFCFRVSPRETLQSHAWISKCSSSQAKLNSASVKKTSQKKSIKEKPRWCDLNVITKMSILVTKQLTN